MFLDHLLHRYETQPDLPREIVLVPDDAVESQAASSNIENTNEVPVPDTPAPSEENHREESSEGKKQNHILLLIQIQMINSQQWEVIQKRKTFHKKGRVM